MTDPIEQQVAALMRAARTAGKDEALTAKRGKVHPANIIGLAVVVVVLICALIGAGVIIASLLSGDWCDAAVGADKLVRGNNMDAARACVSLLMEQLQTLGSALLSVIAMIAVGFVVLVVLLIADGKLSFSASRSGAAASIAGRGDGAPPTPASPEQDRAPTPITPDEETPRP